MLGSYEGSIRAKVITGFDSKQFIPAADYAAKSAFTSQIWKKFDTSRRCLQHNFLLVLMWPIWYTENNSRIQLPWIGLPNRLTTLQFLWQNFFQKSVNPWKLPCSLACEFCSRKETRQESLAPVAPFVGHSELFYHRWCVVMLSKKCQKVLLEAFVMCCEVSQWRLLSKWKSYSSSTDNGLICISYFLYGVLSKPESKSSFKNESKE